MDAAAREARFAQIRADCERQGWRSEDHTISVVRANLMAFVTVGPAAVLCGTLYALLLPDSRMVWSWRRSALFLLLMLAGIFIHELLHGFGWGLFVRDRRSISYGVLWKQATPYCACSEPLSAGKYLVGTLMPFAVLGIGLFLLSLACRDRMLLCLALINILAAGGDTTVAWMLRGCRGALVLDHPTQCGFVAFRK